MDTVSVSASLEELLAGMDSPSRVNLLCTLFSRCSHHEQVAILERVPACLKRDYLSLLPPELVVRVLCFLGAGDVFSCMLVCRHWCRVVSECDPYWKSLCRQIGVGDCVLRERQPDYPSLKALTLAALRYQKRIKLSQACCKEFQIDPKSVGTNDNPFPLRPVEPFSNGMFIQREFRDNKSVLSVKGLTVSGIFSELATATVSPAFFIIWSSSSDDRVLVYSSTGEWVWINILENASYMWEQSEGDIYNMPFYDIASCDKCSLVTVISKAPSRDGFWELVILKLRTGESAVEKRKCSFFFLPDEDLKGNIFFCPQKIALLPSASARPDTKQVDFCCSHTIVVKIGGYIVISNLELFESGNCVVSEPVRALCSHSDPSLCASPSILGEKYCLSCDRKLLGYVTRDTFCVWNLETFKETKCRLDGLESSTVECKAVGHLCSIVCTSSSVCVISSLTGEILLSYMHPGGPAQQLFSPVHQNWLSTFEPRSSLELATVIQKGQSPCVIIL